jgi:hypothetical protein
LAQAWSRHSARHPSKGAPWSWASQTLNHHYRASQFSLLLRALEVKLSSLLRRALGVSQFSPHYRPQGAANPAATAGQHGSTCAIAESVPAHVRRPSIRLAWGPARLRPQDCSGKQLAAEEPIRRRLPRGGKLWSH